MPSLAADSPPGAAPRACAPDESCVRRVIAGLIFLVALPPLALIIGAEPDFLIYRWMDTLTSPTSPFRVGEHNALIIASLWGGYVVSALCWVCWVFAERFSLPGSVEQHFLCDALVFSSGMATLVALLLLPAALFMTGYQSLIWAFMTTPGDGFRSALAVLYTYFAPLVLAMSGLVRVFLVPIGVNITLWQTARHANTLCGGFGLALVTVATLTLVFY